MSARKTVIAFLAIVLLVITIGMLQAKDDKMDGKTLYRTHCKSCHGPDSDNGEYTPMTLIQDQWDRFFDKKYVPAHQNVTDPHFGNKKVIDVISPEMLKEIRKFCVDHAADSEHPMTCG